MSIEGGAGSAINRSIKFGSRTGLVGFERVPLLGGWGHLGRAVVGPWLDGADGFVGRGTSLWEEWPRSFARAASATRALSAATRALSSFSSRIRFLWWSAFGFRPGRFGTMDAVEVASDGFAAAQDTALSASYLIAFFLLAPWVESVMTQISMLKRMVAEPMHR